MALNLTDWPMEMADIELISWWTVNESIEWSVKNRTALHACMLRRLMAKLRNEAQEARLNLPKGRKLLSDLRKLLKNIWKNKFQLKRKI